MSYRCSLWISASPLLMLTGLVCAFLFAGCEEISGPSFVGSSDPKPGAQGPPPQPPTPADPAIAFVARAGGGPWDLRVMNADGSNVRTIYTATAGSQILPSWSPDGHSIAFINSWNLWRIDVTVVNGVPTGTNAAVLLDKTSSLSEPAWSPLGDEIAFVDINLKTLEVVPATGGVPEVLYSSPNTLAYPAWSPGESNLHLTALGWCSHDHRGRRLPDLVSQRRGDSLHGAQRRPETQQGGPCHWGSHEHPGVWPMVRLAKILTRLLRRRESNWRIGAIPVGKQACESSVRVCGQPRANSFPAGQAAAGG